MADPVEYIREEDCDLVRNAISVTLDDKSLPDTIILSEAYAGLANHTITLRTESGEANELRRMAAVFYCAALLVPALPDLIRETDAGVTTEFGQRDKALESKLYARSEECLQLAAGAPQHSTGRMPVLFTSSAA